MRRIPIFATLSMLLIFAPVTRANDDDDLQKIRREVEQLRKIVEKESAARADESKALQTALDEAREQLLKAHLQTTELKAKLAAVDVELELHKKLAAALEKLVAQSAAAEKLPLPEPRETAPVEQPPEPPSVEIHGKIVSIADSGLYVLSIGAVDGAKQGQVFEVIRPGDSPKQLGTIALIRSYDKQSIGQFKPQDGGRAQIGDEVSGRFPK